MKELYEYVLNFMVENDITCPEDICQCDRVQEKLEEFVCDCLDFVKKDLPDQEEQE